MSGDDQPPQNPNRTVFRPSPLQGVQPGAAPPPPQAPQTQVPFSPQPPPQGPAGAAPPAAFPPAPPVGTGAPEPLAAPGAMAPTEQAPPPAPPAPGSPRQLASDDIIAPIPQAETRNPMMAYAARLLSLAANMRSGRAQVDLPRLHAEAQTEIAKFDAAVAAKYSPETRRRATYGLAATLDDIAQNLPGRPGDSAEWARRSLVVLFFQENIGGDRFWQIVDDVLARPHENVDLIELYHACLAAGFQGRFRVMPDGDRRLAEIGDRLYSALEHVRTISMAELVPHWRGVEKKPNTRSVWALLGLIAAIAFGVLLAIYIALWLLLSQSGRPSLDALGLLMPDQPARLSRAAAPAPQVSSPQVDRISGFLAPEIAQKLVVVETDGSTVRVRTTVGTLFESASKDLVEGRRALFERIGAAIETERGPVVVEGHADSDKVSNIAFPDNMALSSARADTVADILRAKLPIPRASLPRARVKAGLSLPTRRPRARRRTAASRSCCGEWTDRPMSMILSNYYLLTGGIMVFLAGVMLLVLPMIFPSLDYWLFYTAIIALTAIGYAGLSFWRSRKQKKADKELADGIDEAAASAAAADAEAKTVATRDEGSARAAAQGERQEAQLPL